VCGIYCVYNNIDKYISNHFPTVREVTHSITTCTQHYKEKTKQSKKHEQEDNLFYFDVDDKFS
jgi:hypothetical protein